MAEISNSLAGLILSGRVYLAIEEPEAPANGDLRVSYDPNHNPGYMKLEVFSAGQWHLLESWLCLEEFRWYKLNRPDSWALAWALAKIFQHLLQALHQHLFIEWDIGRNFLCVCAVSFNVLYRRNVENARFEAFQLRDTHETQP